jgi:hypothetical protein
VPGIRVPATVQAMLAARIDRLPPDQKQLLQAAAVVGKDVPLALLEAVAESAGADDLHRRLTHLRAAEFLYERSLFPDLELTFKHARGNDLWLHARGLQGAHVVVPGPGDSPDARTLGDAALLAAHFSSARDDEAAEVAWTRCKHVRKSKGARAGSVTVTQEKVLRVRLEPERLVALLRTES